MSILEYDPEGPHPLTTIFWILAIGALLITGAVLWIGRCPAKEVPLRDTPAEQARKKCNAECLGHGYWWQGRFNAEGGEVLCVCEGRRPG